MAANSALCCQLYYTQFQEQSYLKVLVTQLCLTLCDPMDCSPRLLCPWGCSRQEYWSGLHSVFQGIFLTRGSNLGLLHGRQILYRLSQSRYARVYLLSFTVNYIYDVWSQSKKLRETTLDISLEASFLKQASS